MSLSCVRASICCTSSRHHRVKYLHRIVPKNISSLPCIYTNQQDSYESIPPRSNWSERLRASFYWFAYAYEVPARRAFTVQAKSIKRLHASCASLYVLVREQLSAALSRIELCNATGRALVHMNIWTWNLQRATLSYIYIHAPYLPFLGDIYYHQG